MTAPLNALNWALIGPSAHGPHLHMALDEVLLDQVIAGARPPTLRLWEWIEPALVIGSHQSVANEVDTVACGELGFTVTRRMSGGGTMLCEPGRTITWSLYLPADAVVGMSFRASYAALDAWAVDALVALGVPAGYREINDIISPRGKIAGAAQARRRGHVLHHTTMAHSMDVSLVRRLIRIGRANLTERGVRSAEKDVSPLEWFTQLSCAEVAQHLVESFSQRFATRPAGITDEELAAAETLSTGKYSTEEWINRIP